MFITIYVEIDIIIELVTSQRWWDSQLFDLKDDPYELTNLAGVPEYRKREGDMMTLLQQWQTELGDTLRLSSTERSPMEYDPSSFSRSPDRHQPESVVRKYFEQ